VRQTIERMRVLGLIVLLQRSRHFDFFGI
jgi:hypothetical protein